MYIRVSGYEKTEVSFGMSALRHHAPQSDNLLIRKISRIGTSHMEELIERTQRNEGIFN